MSREMYSRREVLDILQITEAQLNELVEGNHILEIGIRDCRGGGVSYHVDDVESLLGAAWFYRKYGRKKMTDAQSENEKMILWLNTDFRDQLKKLVKSDMNCQESKGLTSLYVQAAMLQQRLTVRVLDSFLNDGVILGISTMAYVGFLQSYLRDWIKGMEQIIKATHGDKGVEEASYGVLLAISETFPPVPLADSHSCPNT